MDTGNKAEWSWISLSRGLKGARLVISEADETKSKRGPDDLVFMTEAEQGDDPESIAKWIADCDAIPPLEMTAEEEAA